MEMALGNKQAFHVIAWIERNNTVIVGINGASSRPQFRRKFKDGTESFISHAEMDAVAKLGKDIRSTDVLHVMRFTKNGTLSCAKPCSCCEEYLRKKGIRQVKFSDWDGQWVRMVIE